MPKVEKFLNMVAEDFKKKLCLLIKRLDNIDLVRVIGQWHSKRGRSRQEGERCLEELRAYIAKLRQVVQQDSLAQHFSTLIDTLVSHLQQGAKDTASRRLYAHSTLHDDHSLYSRVETASDTLSSESGKRKAIDTLAAFWVDTKKAREGSPSSQEQGSPLHGEEESSERDGAEYADLHYAGDERVQHRGGFEQGNPLNDEHHGDDDGDDGDHDHDHDGEHEHARVEHALVEHARVEHARVEHALVEHARVEHARVEPNRVEPNRGDGERAVHRHAGDKPAERRSSNERVGSRPFSGGAESVGGRERGGPGASGSQHRGAKSSRNVGSGGGSKRSGVDASGDGKRGSRVGSSGSSKRGGRSDLARGEDEHGDA